MNGFLSGSQTVSKTTGQPKSVSNGVTVDVFAFSNGCTNESIGFAEAGFAGTFDSPNKKLDSAGLTGSGLLQDFDTGVQVPISVDVEIDATGPLTSTSASTKTKTVDGPGGPVTITIERSSNSNRNGTATGTIIVDGVTFQIDDPSGCCSAITTPR